MSNGRYGGETAMEYAGPIKSRWPQMALQQGWFLLVAGPLTEPVGCASLVESREEILYLRGSQHGWALTALSPYKDFHLPECLRNSQLHFLHHPGSLGSAIWAALSRSICLVTSLSQSSSTAQDSLGNLQSPGQCPEKPNIEHIWTWHKGRKCIEAVGSGDCGYTIF